MDDFLRKVLKISWDAFQTVVIAFAIFVLIYRFVAQPHRVDGASMEPNFHHGEFILTEKISYYLGSPKREDVIVFRFTKGTPEVDYIKRIIALPGETIRIHDQRVYINDELLAEDYLAPNQPTNGHSFLKNEQSYTLGADEYLVLGDNRGRSSDSRQWGPTKREDIVGRAFFRYWPFGRINLVAHSLGN